MRMNGKDKQWITVMEEIDKNLVQTFRWTVKSLNMIKSTIIAKCMAMSKKPIR